MNARAARRRAVALADRADLVAAAQLDAGVPINQVADHLRDRLQRAAAAQPPEVAQLLRLVLVDRLQVLHGLAAAPRTGAS